MKSLNVLLMLIILGVVVMSPLISYADMKGKDGQTMNSMKDNNKTKVAISGYCPVCVIHGMAMKGKDHFVTEYKGKVYKFVGFNEQKTFIENPEEYTKDLEMKFQQLKK